MCKCLLGVIKSFGILWYFKGEDNFKFWFIYFFFFGGGDRGIKKKKKLFCVLILRDACELGIAMSLYFPRGIQKPGLEYAAINLSASMDRSIDCPAT